MPSTRKSKPVFGAIAGTGVIDHFAVGKPRKVVTKYGTAEVFEAEGGGYYVLPRHGPGHSVPPHRINYRANIAALEALGVTSIVATSAVGSMNKEFRVGDIGTVGQFLDFTKSRASTFYDDEVKHTDVTKPYSQKLNKAIAKTGEKVGAKVRGGLVYVCAEGPRFETAAEIRMFRAMGGDVVGMTGVPEVVLANEKGIEYASVVIATNWAAGLQAKVSHDEVLKVMRRSGKLTSRLIDMMIGGSR